jgi:hypothetical protein
MPNESVRDGLSPRAARKSEARPAEPEPAAPDQAESQVSDEVPGASGPADWLAPESGTTAPNASAPGSATDWLATPPAAPDSPTASSPEDWLAPAEPEQPPGFDTGQEAEPGLEVEPGPERGQRIEPEEPLAFEPGFEPELETDPASAAAFHASVPRPYPTAYALQNEAEIQDLDEEDVEDDRLEDEFEPELTLAQRLKRTPPALVILGLGAIGSAVFMAYEVASHTAPISVLTSAGVATGLIYGAVAIVAGMASYRAAEQGRAARSYLLAFAGGSAAIVACGSFAGALILFLALGF